MAMTSIESYPPIRVEIRVKGDQAQWDQVRAKSRGRLRVLSSWKPLEFAQREAEAFAQRHQVPLLTVT